jgi:hypothetical protein
MNPSLSIAVNRSLGFTSYDYTIQIPVKNELLVLTSELIYDSFQECVDALTATWNNFAPDI